ncbi:hypothetical protein OVA24_08510 [Luteolibacter sp. SL250]|uniref:hypothetical protein n=1 Tax=Luteolibacter sp. SL250 TaxID=2995170 RepID=UPI00226F5EEA|nr:hypothetical protein [Luteolibacter sp. SL250]WAC21427.1 hypothetical protein OVA24_08510 [Luteolibacter sp. SL250]
MRSLPFLVLAVFSTVHAASLQLPTWKDDERKAFEEAGGILRSFILADDPEPEPETPLDVEKPKADEVTNDPLRSSEIPEKFLSAYFAEKPTEFLVDPQGLLNPKDYKDRLGFLKYHAGDSSIDFFVYVFGGEQEIPGEVRAEETVERLFTTGRPAVVVFYFLGAPQRSAIHLSPSLTETVSAADQRRALQSSVMSAFEKLNTTDQLDAFSVQMSIRIYWMERMLGGGGSPEEIPVFSHRPAAKKVAAPSALDVWKEQVSIWVREWWGGVSLLLGGGLLVSSFVAWMRSRMRFRFPDLEVEPRLGGSHAAGVGAVISFASAALPPASQKDQVPDYLRRA